MPAAGDGTRLSASKKDSCLVRDKDDDDGVSMPAPSLKPDSADMLERHAPDDGGSDADMGFSGC